MSNNQISVDVVQTFLISEIFHIE